MQQSRNMTLHMVRRMRGITLLELMAVVVIIGILLAIAYPNYREFVARAKRTEAKSLLLEIAANQERFYLNAQRFGTMTELNYPTDPVETSSGSYDVTVTVNNASTFTAVATYKLGGSELGRCTTFTIDAAGNRTTTGSISNCWIKER